MYTINVYIRRLVHTWVRPVCFVVLAVWLLANPLPAAAAVTVTIGSDEVAPGGTVTVPLQVSGVVNLGAVTLEIHYDPTVLDATACNADPGGVFDVALCNPDFDDDGVGTDAVRFTAASVGGVSGNIVLAEITFQAVGQSGDTSVLDVVRDGEVLADTQGSPIDFTDVDGLITITPLLPPSIPVGGNLSVVDRGAVLRTNFGSLIVPLVASVMFIAIIGFVVIRRRPTA